MQKLYLTFLLSMILAAFGMQAQVVVTDPPVLQENSQNVVIYFYADQGNRQLINQPSTAAIYAHTGVITNLSASGSDWKHAPDWLDNSAKYKLDYVSDNVWKLDIGSIREYYGVGAGETVKQLCFVFRKLGQ